MKDVEASTRRRRAVAPVAAVAVLVLVMAGTAVSAADGAGDGAVAAAAAIASEGSAPADIGVQQVQAPARGQRQGVVRPVPGRVVRVFAAPATRYGSGHRGVDLAAEPGDAVRAAIAGTITFSGIVARVGWVTVDHGGGLRTTYGPLDPRRVRVGQRVAAGAQLGKLAAGASHLDWGALLHGVYIDPMSLLGRWEVHLVRPARREAHAG